MAIASGGSSGIDTGLAYKGLVTAIPGANQFTIPSFIGKGLGKFNGATGPYGAYVFRDAGGLGAAPQGEMQLITAFNSLTGTFTTAAFTVPVQIGDEIIIMNPSLADILVLAASPAPAQIALLHGVAPVTGFTTGNWNAGGIGGTPVCSIGAAGIRYKVHSLMIDISALGGNVTPILTININGANKKIFPAKAGLTFNVAAGDAPGIAIINGTFGIASALVVRVYSDAPGDDGTNINYEYFIEAM